MIAAADEWATDRHGPQNSPHWPNTLDTLMKVPLSYLPKAGKFQVQKSTIRFTAVGDLPGIRGTSFISHETLDDVADGIVKEIDRSVANAQEAKSKPLRFPVPCARYLHQWLCVCAEAEGHQTAGL